MERLKVGETREVVVRAVEYWNRSGIAVQPGERYAMRVTRVEDWVDFTLTATLDGLVQVPWYMDGWLPRALRCPEAEWYALVGTVGDRLDRCFTVGSQAAYEARHEGELRFFANDAPFASINNRGTLTLAIERTA
jgi:hypothetical protein